MLETAGKKGNVGVVYALVCLFRVFSMDGDSEIELTFELLEPTCLYAHGLVASECERKT